jgi:hypothetical protein
VLLFNEAVDAGQNRLLVHVASLSHAVGRRNGPGHYPQWRHGAGQLDAALGAGSACF